MPLRVGAALPYNATLTYKASLHTLCEGLRMTEYRPNASRLQGDLWRYVFLTPECVSWVKGALRTISKSDTAYAAPWAQLEAKLRSYCDGIPLRYQDLHISKPQERGVWEIKTVDVRVFGWFPDKDYLILHTGEDAQSLHDDLMLYKPFIDATTAYRDGLSPGLPGPIMSKELIDVVSDRRV
jgi:hypothetical protein